MLPLFQDIVLNQRILTFFRTKLQNLLLKGLKAKKSGGRQYRAFLECLNHSEPYRFKIYISETCKLKLAEINKRLLKQNCELQDQLGASASKQQKLESDLGKARSVAKFWKLKFKGIVKKFIEQQRQIKICKRKNIAYADYSERSKFRIKGELKDNCQLALDFMGLYELVPYKVTFYDPVGESFDSLSLISEEEFSLSSAQDSALPEEQVDKLDDVLLLLYIKDKFNISNKAWCEISMFSSKLPSYYTLNNRLKSLNKQWVVYPTPGGADGVQVKFKESLLMQVERLLRNRLISGNILKIKLTGDGTRVGKHLQLLNISYCIINEEVAATEKGNYVLAVIKIKENYEGIKDSLKDLREEMATLETIVYAGATFNVEFFLGGDWKFLATVCGIGPANQNIACIWCLCPRVLRHDVSQEWPLNDKDTKVSRTIDSIKKDSISRKNNCQHVPLFEFIPMDHVIIDTLHLFLRISDVLLENLIWALKTADAIDKRVAFTTFDIAKHSHMDRFLKYLSSLNIPFTFDVSKDTKKLVYRTLTGPEKLLVFKTISVKDLLPGFKDAALLQSIFTRFLDLYFRMKETFSSNEIVDTFQEEVKEWIRDFLKIYQTKDVTPYMHAFNCHVPQFLKLYNNISYFNQQGLEKYNDQVSKDYFQSSNHRDTEALQQMILKKTRIQYLEAKGAERLKGSYQCSNCKCKGHSIKTCTKQCSSCTEKVLLYPSCQKELQMDEEMYDSTM